MIVYKEKNYEIRHVTYNCHPETCSHWEHYPFVILKDGSWYSDEDDLYTAKNKIKGLLK